MFAFGVGASLGELLMGLVNLGLEAGDGFDQFLRGLPFGRRRGGRRLDLDDLVGVGGFCGGRITGVGRGGCRGRVDGIPLGRNIAHLVADLVDQLGFAVHRLVGDQVGQCGNIERTIEGAVAQFHHPYHLEFGDLLGVDPTLAVIGDLVAGRDTPVTGPLL